MHRFTLLVVVTGMLAACGRSGASAAEDDGIPSLSELATAWSGGQASPTCGDYGRRGESYAVTGQKYCEWTPPSGVEVVGHVSALTERSGAPRLLTWERPAADSADADRLTDSLNTAFLARGLSHRLCGEGEVPAGRVRAMLWEGPGLIAHTSRISPQDSAPRLVTMVTNLPDSFPDVLCPRTPPPLVAPPGS